MLFTSTCTNAIRLFAPLLFCLVQLSQHAVAQATKYTISGTIKNKASGETLIGATVRVAELPGTGAATNEFGNFSITLPAASYTLLIDYVGFQQQQQQVNLDKSLRLTIGLESQSRQLSEVVVTSTRADQNVRSPQAGVEKLDMQEINLLPVLMGERDVLKTVQLLPGIKSAGEGNAGFYVRGGGADQNLILLDDAPVYNASHLLGFFSTFNSDAIKDVTVYKGGMPAEYGGRLSSVLDIKMNDGNNQDYKVSGGIGLISARLNVEGPIQKDKSSFLISGRRTYADTFLKLSGDDNFRNSSLYFYDLNAKLSYTLSEKDRLFVSGYFGRDKLGFRDQFGIDWGNATGTVRWSHLISDRLFSNTSFIFSDYSYKIGINTNNNNFEITSRIQDLNLKQEFDFFPNPQNAIKFGINAIYHKVVPGEISVTGESNINPSALQERYSLENAAYITNTWTANERLSLIYGLRVTSFSIFGKGDFYTLNQNREVTGFTSYGSGEIVKTYFNLEPRLSGAYQLNETSSLKASYARTSQYLHLLSNSTTTNPTDRWVPSSNNIKPGLADQVSLGYFRNFSDNLYEFGVEGYYKHMQNQIDYKDGANITNSDIVETELLFGKGRAYGVEFFLKKKYGRFNGWIGYTLSRSERLIEGINNNNWYAARQDRTHDISIVGIYQLSEKWTLSGNWVYNTGNAVTFPSGKYRVDDQVVFYYTERNGYRMPDYHRMDIGATKTLKDTEKYSSELVFSIYNVYGRENAFLINFRENEVDPSRTEAYQIALFKMVPSISYNFRF
ncbi:TonB-dependent receptor [Pontibacter qinzhouensis]|uniref:TonB-dependent receptor n=1 Tax=Pontibacter qinzhouensis TaxID=2603253 RepID=A0A5C8KBL5_9BACT|nr:TonB-dependent receptor [Pontibacter qinzhouensis]